MAAPDQTEIIEIKQEPPSPPEPAEEPGFCDDDIPNYPSNANLSSENDDLPPASDFLSVQIKEEPPCSPIKDTSPSSPTMRAMHANPVPISCLATSMASANHSALEEEMVEAILPDRGPRSPSPEPTFEMTASIKEEIDWEAPKEDPKIHNVLLKIKEEPVDWQQSGDVATEVQGPSSATEPSDANLSEKAVYLVRTASAGNSAAQPRWTLKRKNDGSEVDVVSAKQLLTDSTSGQGANIKRIKERIKEYHQTKTCLENRIEALQNEKAEFEAKIKANTKHSKLDQLQTDADRGVVKAKFLLDQLRCYGKGTYDWSEETLRVCKQWAKKFPQDYKQCSMDFLTLPTLLEMGIKAGNTVYETATDAKEGDTSEDSQGSD